MIDHKITCACSTTERKQHMASTSALANLKQALASNTRAFSLADQARGIGQQKRELQ
jgi:hypothetical protein